jgi:hypothetical protein
MIMKNGNSFMKNETDPGQDILLLKAKLLVIEIALGEMQKLLAAVGIPMLLLKGPHLAATLYDNPLQRVYCDLDILVKPEHYYPAAKILLANHFKLFSLNRRRLVSEKADYQLLLRAPRGIAVELHRALADRDQFRSDVKGFFQRSEEFKFGDLKVRGLGTEDLLLHLCLHFGKRHFMTSEQKHLLDIALFLKKKNVAWPVFLQRVRLAGCRSVVFYCLQAVQSQHGAVIPDGILPALMPTPRRQRVLNRYLDPTVFPIYRFQDTMPGFRERMVNLLLLDRISRMISSILGFAVRTSMDLVLRVKIFRCLWIKRHPLGEWITQC